MRLRGLAAILFYAAACHGAPPIAGDGTLGTAISRAGNAWSINGGTQLGGNLFQSFARFNVLTGHSATFHGPGSVQHIVGRVTGGSVSSIDGVLRSAIPGASLWLMNPKGVMFGPNASLDVSGSFHVTTADHLKLGASGQFNATHPGESTLASAPPSAFGFLGPAVAPIRVNGAALRLAGGGTLSIVGGALTLADASVSTRGGDAVLGATAAASEFDIASRAWTRAADAPLGGIAIADSWFETGLSATRAAGAIAVRAGKLEIQDSTLSSENRAPAPGKGISIQVDGLVAMHFAGLMSDTRSAAAAGGIEVAADSVTMNGGSVIGSLTFGAGRGGDVSVAAARSVRVTGRQTAIFADTQPGAGGGRAGDVSVTTAALVVADGAAISSATFGAGRGGDVSVAASESIRLSNANAPGGFSGIGTSSESAQPDAGAAGAVSVATGRLEVLDGAAIGASTFGRGAGGIVSVSASDSILLSGRNSDRFTGIGVNSYSEDAGGGAAGDIRVTSRRLTVLDGATITSSSFGTGKGGGVFVAAAESLLLSGLNTDAFTGIASNANFASAGAGNAGNVEVSAASLRILDGAEIASSSFGPGSGGDISAVASGAILLSGSNVPDAFTGIAAQSVSRAAGAGVAGSISVAGAQIAIYDGAKISSSSFGPGGGGDVAVRATDSIVLSGGRGVTGIFAETHARSPDAGGAGNISIASGQLSVLDGAAISSSSFGRGRGGNVSVNARDRILLSGLNSTGFFTGIGANSEWNAASAGAAGRVDVSAARLSVLGGAEITSSTFGPGQGGNVTVQASDSILLSGLHAADAFTGIAANSNSRQAGAGAAGSVSVTAGRLTVQDGALISSSTFGPGRGGNVSVRAGDSILLSGANEPVFATGIEAVSDSGRADAGNAGNVTVAAERLSVLDGAKISSSTYGGGRGGSVTVNASDSIVLAAANAPGVTTGITANSNSGAPHAGDAGSVYVSGRDIRVADGAEISSSSFGPGLGGSVTVQATDALRLAAGGMIRTEALSSDGGDIVIQAGELVYLNASQITTSVGTGAGNGGNISIDPTFVVLIDSQIIANAFGGNGGNISIVADNFLTMNSLVQASSQLGISGNVQIAAPKVDVSSGLATLNANYLDASSLMRESCAARAGRSQANSFTGTGRGGLAQGPGALGAQVEDKVSLAPQIRSGRLQLASAGCD